MLQSVDWLRVLGALTGLRVCVNAEIVGCVNQICPQWHGMGRVLGSIWRAGKGPPWPIVRFVQPGSAPLPRRRVKRSRRAALLLRPKWQRPTVIRAGRCWAPTGRVERGLCREA